jgi:zinc D-Ala-D-Ala carboxypeptidase
MNRWYSSPKTKYFVIFLVIFSGIFFLVSLLINTGVFGAKSLSNVSSNSSITVSQNLQNINQNIDQTFKDANDATIANSQTKKTLTKSSLIATVKAINSKSSINKVSQSSLAEVLQSIRELSGPEFQELYESTKYQNVVKDDSKPEIFTEENEEAKKINDYIRAIAENRGYRRRLQAVEEYLVAVDGQRLQPEARDAWLKLKENAQKDGINLVLVSGYRSVADQKSIFVNDLASEYNPEQILNGSLDVTLNRIMDTRSIPGYSRHHTGYTMDIACGNSDLLTFKDTPCYEWVRANNFAKAKEVGLIPSYPAGVQKQGPKPEEWEFVWVGEIK